MTISKDREKRWLLNHAHESRDLRGNVGDGNNPGP
jgi:hypothetical protein